MVKWNAKVDRLVGDVRKTCLEAKSSAEMDALIIRISDLQSQPLADDTAIGGRMSQKLHAVTALAKAWTTYLDFRNADHAKPANDILRGLLENQSEIPILTTREVQGRFISPEDDTRSVSPIMRRVLAGVNGPEDIREAIERLERESKEPGIVEGDLLSGEKEKLDRIEGAWQLAKRGEDEAAVDALQYDFNSGLDGFRKNYESLREKVVRQVLRNKGRRWPKWQPSDAERVQVSMNRLIDQLQADGDLESMTEAMDLHDELISAGFPTDWLSDDREIVGHFLSAKRFESVGDILMAVHEYRAVVAAGGKKYAPTKEAVDALRRLKDSHPDVFKDYDSAVLSELQNLRQEFQLLKKHVRVH